MATVTITLVLNLPDDVDLAWVPEEPVVLTGEQAFSQAGAIYSSLHPENLDSNGKREIVWEGWHWYYRREIRCL